MLLSLFYSTKREMRAVDWPLGYIVSTAGFINKVTEVQQPKEIKLYNTCDIWLLGGEHILGYLAK